MIFQESCLDVVLKDGRQDQGFETRADVDDLGETHEFQDRERGDVTYMGPGSIYKSHTTICAMWRVETDTKFGTYRFSRGAVIICVYTDITCSFSLLFVGWLCCNLIALFGPPHDRGYFMTLALSNKDEPLQKVPYSTSMCYLLWFLQVWTQTTTGEGTLFSLFFLWLSSRIHSLLLISS